MLLRRFGLVPFVNLGTHCEFGPVEMGDGRQLTSHYHSELIQGVTADVVEHPNGNRTLTLLNASRLDGAHFDWKARSPLGTDIVCLHTNHSCGLLHGPTWRSQSVTAQQLAEITTCHRLGNRPITLLGCKIGHVVGGFLDQYSLALGGQQVTAPTADYYSQSQVVGRKLLGWFVEARPGWRTVGRPITQARALEGK